MGHLVKISPSRQVRIPKALLEKLRTGPGDYLEFELEGDRLVGRAKVVIDKSQAWFWSAEWQEKEREADEDIKTGRVSGPFETVDDLRRALEGPDEDAGA